MNRQIPNRVYFIGAGPGSALLLTQKARVLLDELSVFIVDHLVSTEILSLIPPGKKIINVGKYPGHHPMSQEDINEIILKEFRAEKAVGRLKGGDPVVFGRLGEEIEFLQRHNIPYEVVPGISSALACAAYSGFSLTKRRVSSKIYIVTGHKRKDEMELNFPGFDKESTYVILMPVGNLKNVISELISKGVPETSPVVIVQSAFRWGSKVIKCRLDQLLDVASVQNIRPPSVLIVGEATKDKIDTNYIHDIPLLGKRIVVTRPFIAAKRDIINLQLMGAEVVLLPCIRTGEPKDLTPLANSLKKIESFDWIIFTSANAIEPFFNKLFEFKKDTRALNGVKICAIGSATCDKLIEKGIKPDYVPTKFVAESILEELPKAGIKKNDRILLPRTKMARSTLKEGLLKYGCLVEENETYTTLKEEPHRIVIDRLLKEGCDYITFTSPSTVYNFFDILTEEKARWLIDRSYPVSIGPVTTSALKRKGVKKLIQAETYTMQGLIEAIVRHAG